MKVFDFLIFLGIGSKSKVVLLRRDKLRIKTVFEVKSDYDDS